MAKLIDLMRQAGVQWPEGAEYAAQDSDREVKFGAAGAQLSDNGTWIRDMEIRHQHIELKDLADDWGTLVTHYEWFDCPPQSASYRGPDYMREQQRIAARRQERHDMVLELMLRHPELTGQQAIAQADEIIATLEGLRDDA